MSQPQAGRPQDPARSAGQRTAQGQHDEDRASQPPPGPGPGYSQPAWSAPPPPPWPPGHPGGTQTRSSRSGRALTMAAVAVVAVVVAVIITMVAIKGPSSAPASASQPPAAGAPVIGGQGGNGGTLMMAGTVTRVSSGSITLNSGGYQVTAAITSSTRFTGVSGPGQIKPGDRVSAQITGYGSGHRVATGIQDPLRMP